MREKGQAMKNAVEVLEKIETEAKKRAKPDPVHYGSMAVGDKHWQGDVAIVKLDKVPKNSKSTPTVAQLAPGNTQGSRHILASTDGVTMYVKPDATPLDGPIVEAKKPIEITHPEHGHVHLQPGVYQIGYQRQYAQELKRVQD
jgi:hypothetical protein